MFLEAGTDGPAKGPGINFATFQSAVHGVANWKELQRLRRQLYPYKMPTLTPKVKKRSFLSKSEEVDKWCILFPGSDRSVMVRSERSRYEHDALRPAQVQAYVALPSFF